MSRPESKPRKYDMRVVDQFYTYCNAVAQADRHREAATGSLHATKRQLWTILIVASVLAYYLVERVVQAMSLF